MKAGEKLIAAGLINEGQLNQALEAQKATGETLGATIVKLGFASKDAVEKALA